MARSDKTPFKREYTISSNGVLGNEEFYVPDIRTLYFTVSPTGGADGLIQGKIGLDGNWVIIPFTVDSDGNSGAIDITPFEYVRFQALSVIKETNINIVGFYSEPNKEKTSIEFAQRELDIMIENNHSLKHIEKQLEILNEYMSIIIGDKI